MKSLTRRLLFGLPIPYFLASKQAEAGLGSINRPTTTPAVWNRTELYFGTGRPDGSVVSDAEFQQFVDIQVTPRFPDGLTLLAGYGQSNARFPPVTATTTAFTGIISLHTSN